MNTQTEFRIKLLVTKICIDSTRNGVATVDDEKKLLEEVDEYAQQQAVEFYRFIFGMKEGNDSETITWTQPELISLNKLYQLFLNDQQK